ncbi:hypothetical protein JCM8547_005923 [Rhodosporidiobolus lusitaniae]
MTFHPTPIVFDKMFATQQHKGTYLLVRTVSLPRLETDMGVRIVAEDIKGRAEESALHYVQLGGMVTGPDLDQLFPLGTVLAIREPTVECMAELMRNTYIIRVPTPADYKVVQQDDPLLDGLNWATLPAAVPLTASFDHKAAGKVFYKQRKYVLAVKAYSDGLAKSPSNQEKLLLYLNRAQANLPLENFKAARKDMSATSDLLESVEVPPATVEKVILRRARALEGLRLFEQAKAEYGKLATAVDSSEGKEGVKRMKRLLFEAANGISEAKSEELDRACTDAPMLFARGFHADEYSAPLGAISTQNGKGLIVTRDVAAGEVLLGSPRCRPSRRLQAKFFRSSNITMGCSFATSTYSLIESLVAKLIDQGDPSLLSAVSSSLCGGADYPPLETPTVSTKRDEAKWTAPRSTSTSVDSSLSLLATSPFPAPGIRRTTSDSAARALQAQDAADAHFPIASLIPHSCGPSDHHLQYRDVMVVRARRPVKAGEGVSIPFITYSQSAEEHAAWCRPLFPNGVCPCELCTADRNLDRAESLNLRHKFPGASFSLLKERLKATQNDPRRQAIGRELDALIRKLNKTYAPDRSPLRRELFEPYAPPCLAAGAEFETGDDGKVKVVAAPILCSQKPYQDVLFQSVALLCQWTSPHRDEKKAVEFLSILRHLASADHLQT